ncbi:MAG: exosortase F-associated protein [Salibacteraceae bacterium]|jgi:exosortase F-associated protein
MHKHKWLAVIGLLGFVMVRFASSRIFYDPLIHFFHQGDYQIQELPDIIYWKFMISLFFRFGTNTLLTLFIVHIIFEKIDLVKLTAIILGGMFLLLSPILLILLFIGNPDNYQFLFYTRRVLIHPVLALILIPAYLYHQRTFKINSND